MNKFKSQILFGCIVILGILLSVKFGRVDYNNNIKKAPNCSHSFIDNSAPRPFQFCCNGISGDYNLIADSLIENNGNIFSLDKDGCVKTTVDYSSFQLIPPTKGVSLFQQHFGKESHEITRLSSGYYFKDKNSIYFNLEGMKEYRRFEYDHGAGVNLNKKGAYPLSGVDINSFMNFDNVYAKDKNKVYFGSLIVTGADADSFEVLSLHHINKYEDKGYDGIHNKEIFGLGKDKNHLYFLGKRVLGDNYSNGNIIENINSIEYIGENLFWNSVDQSLYYFKGLSGIPGYSGAFPVLYRTNYSTEKLQPHKTKGSKGEFLKNPFFPNDTLVKRDKEKTELQYNVVDINSFEVINCAGSTFAKDKNNIYEYHTFTVISGADTVSFNCFSESYSPYQKDKNSIYFKGQKLDLNIKNLQWDANDYGKISDGVKTYNYGILMK